MSSPSDLLAGLLSTDGSRPLFTFYDDATGERVELSVATTANWVAKTANYLSDEAGVDVDDVVSVSLPLHWQTAVVLLAAWAVGAQVSFEAGGLVQFTAGTGAGGANAIELSLAPMGVDFSRLVAAQPDAFIPTSPAGADLVEAAPIDLPHGARVLTVVSYDEPNGLGYGLIGPLAVDGSVVIVRHPDPAALADRVATERVSHTLGITVDGVPRLDS